MSNLTYKNCKFLIEKGRVEGMMDKLDVFLLGDRISREQYEELVALIEK